MTINFNSPTKEQPMAQVINLTEVEDVIVSTTMKCYTAAGVTTNSEGNISYSVQYFAHENDVEAKAYSLKSLKKQFPPDAGYSNHQTMMVQVDTSFLLAVLAGKITKEVI
jgi:hypothetical protein